ncbi:hypothetical protein EJ07DRAFT_159701 [Lizonia empirigonia]|nr:hypothetical protein EJ07DRAFT_159701 [Lizonia empirigonia]
MAPPQEPLFCIEVISSFHDITANRAHHDERDPHADPVAPALDLFPSCETRSTDIPAACDRTTRAGRHLADACYGGYHRDVRAAGRSLVSWARERRGVVRTDYMCVICGGGFGWGWGGGGCCCFMILWIATIVVVALSPHFEIAVEDGERKQQYRGLSYPSSMRCWQRVIAGIIFALVPQMVSGRVFQGSVKSAILLFWLLCSIEDASTMSGKHTCTQYVPGGNLATASTRRTSPS